MDITSERLTALRETGFVLADKAADYTDEQVKSHLGKYRKQAALRASKAGDIRNAVLGSLNT